MATVLFVSAGDDLMILTGSLLIMPPSPAPGRYVDQISAEYISFIIIIVSHLGELTLTVDIAEIV